MCRQEVRRLELGRAMPIKFGFCYSDFFRHSSLGIRHLPFSIRLLSSVLSPTKNLKKSYPIRRWMSDPHCYAKTKKSKIMNPNHLPNSQTTRPSTDSFSRASVLECGCLPRSTCACHVPRRSPCRFGSGTKAPGPCATAPPKLHPSGPPPSSPSALIGSNRQ
jgi:hypothetical protein